MSENTRKRVRKVDVNQMSVEQADKISEAIGKELAKIFDDANEKANELLTIYGLETKLNYQIKKKSK
jgi:uncharacterized protein YbcI